MQITPANMYTNHSPIEYASLKIIRTCLYYQSNFPKVTHFTSIGKGGHIRSILTVGDDLFSLRKMSEVHIQSLNLALHVHVYSTTHDMKMSRLLDGLISVHPFLDFKKQIYLFVQHFNCKNLVYSNRQQIMRSI